MMLQSRKCEKPFPPAASDRFRGYKPETGQISRLPDVRNDELLEAVCRTFKKMRKAPMNNIQMIYEIAYDYAAQELKRFPEFGASDFQRHPYSSRSSRGRGISPGRSDYSWEPSPNCARPRLSSWILRE